MPAFRVSGATGQAPTTSFFGTVPDKYNMLTPLYFFNNGVTHGSQLTSQLFACNRINQWVPWDTAFGGGGASNLSATIGATTTAPDGTATGYHVTEGTNNGYHIMVAGSTQPQTRGQASALHTKRLAIFAKAAERTRCYIAMADNLALLQDSGCYCVFDLAGGRIGVPLTSYGNDSASWIPVGTGMVPFGNGWYMCYIDVAPSTNAFTVSGVLASVFGPDAGSGTGALNNQYAGNGTSGVFAWNTNFLPPRAWSMNTMVFASEFNSFLPSDVDINNTQLPGYNWYVSPHWSAPGLGDAVYIDPLTTSQLSISSSVLTVQAQPVGKQANMFSAVQTAGPSYIGNAFQPSWMMELRGSWQYSINTSEFAFWSLSIEQLINSVSADINGNGCEMDLVDEGGAGGFLNPIFAVFSPIISPAGQDDNMLPYNGYVFWSASLPYAINNVIGFNGQAYISLVNSNLNNQPDLNLGTKWAVFTPVAPNPSVANSLFTSFDQMHVYTFMRIRDNSVQVPYDTGSFLCFFDGIFCNVTSGLPGEIVYGSSTATHNGIFQPQDALHNVLITSSSRTANSSLDYWRVTQ